MERREKTRRNVVCAAWPLWVSDGWYHASAMSLQGWDEVENENASASGDLLWDESDRSDQNDDLKSGNGNDQNERALSMIGSENGSDPPRPEYGRAEMSLRETEGLHKV